MVAAPPPIAIPAEISPTVPFPVTTDMVLLAISVVPEEAVETAIPTAEKFPEFETVPILLFVIVAFITSLPAVVVARKVLPNPQLIAILSGEPVPEILEIVFPDITTPLSKPTQIPPFTAAVVFMRF